MSYFQYHVFFCTNQREEGAPSCGVHGAKDMRDYAKARVKELGLDGPGKVRVTNAGCLGRCDQGPLLVVYPEAVWYTYVDQEDIDDIINSHLVNGKVVERLKV